MPPAPLKKGKAKKVKPGVTMDEDELLESAVSGSLDINSILKEGGTYHAPDALDFEDEDELADDELPDDEGGTEEQAGESARLTKSGSGEKFDHDGADDDDDDDDIMNQLEQEGLAVEEEEDNFGHKPDDMQLDPGQQIGESDIEDSFDDEEDRKQEEERLAQKKRKTEERLLRTFYPDFKPGVIMKMIPTFSSLDYADYAWYRPPLPQTPLIPTKLQFEVDVDERKIFNKQANKASLWKPAQTSGNNSATSDIRSALGQSVIAVPFNDVQVQVPDKQDIKHHKPGIHDFDPTTLLAACDWDDEKILNAGDNGSEGQQIGEARPSKRFKIDPYELDDWMDDDDIFEGQINLQSLNLKLDSNDPHVLLFKSAATSKEVAKGSIHSADASFESKFDISNDKAYDILRANYQTKIRSTVGDLTIEHSAPATRLQYPYYKIKITSQNARMLHRPQLRIRPGTVWFFSKPRKRKSKKDKGKTITELFAKSNDLSLGDTANFFLMEYSEEVPLALSNFGMASKVINYYRKRNLEDTTRPKLLVGETHVLGVQDKSPFWNFGFVEPGNVVPTLYNRMTRAPVFKQEALETDFLLVKSRGGPTNALRFYIRPIQHIFTVGQQFPAVEIPGPHSRKVTSTSKNRLKMIAYRFLNKDNRHRLSAKEFSKHFPDQSDMQNRQRLKEFVEYQRTGEDQGFWKLKPGEMLPNYEQIRNMIVPEDISLLESMSHSDQYLNDVSYYYGDEEEMEKRRQKMKEKTNYNNKSIGEETMEEQLASWNVTRNFLNAVQGKAMLQIHGEGDFSGKGEAFSFLRTSMKGGFKSSNDDDSNLAMTPGTPGTPMGAFKGEKKRGRKKDEDKLKVQPSHRYSVANQQKLYEEEISKVWYAQQKNFSDDGSGGDKGRVRELDSSELVDDLHEGTEVHLKNVEPPNPKLAKKFLKITRMVRDSNGILQRKTEIVREPAVIKAYIERKIRLQVASMDDNLDPDMFGPGGDAEQKERMKKVLMEEIERLEKSTERKKKKGRKKNVDDTSAAGTPSASAGGNGDDYLLSFSQASKKSGVRKCKRCGAAGHISTNKKLCPMYQASDAPTPTSVSEKEIV